MNDYPSGSNIVLKANVDDENMYFVGYKYNYKKQEYKVHKYIPIDMS